MTVIMKNTKATFSEFRDNLSAYLNLLASGRSRIEITDGRTGKTMLKVVKDDKPEFDWKKHLKTLKKMKPFLTDIDLKDMVRARGDIDKRLKIAKGR